MAVKKKNLPLVSQDHALSLGLSDQEWARMQDGLGRAPNEVECALFAALWSEEYSFKSTLSFLKTLYREGANLVKMPGDRVGVVDLGQGLALVLRGDAANALCKQEAQLGAQASLSNVMQSISSLGAKPVALFTVVRTGTLEEIENIRLLQNEVQAISRYSNLSGVPILGGELYCHSGFDGGPVVNAFCLGLIKRERLIEQSRSELDGTILVIGRETTKEKMPWSDPLFAQSVATALEQSVSSGIFLDLLEIGVGGVATALFELARRLGSGIRIDLDRVPQRCNQNETLSSLQVLLSETPYRFLAVVPKGKHRVVADLLQPHGLHTAVIGELVDSDDVQIDWHHQEVANIPYVYAREGLVQKEFELSKFPPMLRKQALDEAAAATKTSLKRHGKSDEWTILRDAPMLQKQARAEGIVEIPESLADVWVDLLADPNICSRQRVIEHFDQGIGLNAIFTAQADSTLIRLKDSADGKKGIAVTVDANSLYVKLDPYLGTVLTVAEAMRNIAAVGGEPVAIGHCLNLGDPARHSDISEMSEVIRGLGDACRAWKLPSISDCVSLCNGTAEGTAERAIFGTPAVLMVGVVSDIAQSKGIAFVDSGDKVFLLGTTKAELGGSEYLSYYHKQVSGNPPDIDFDLEQRSCNLMRALTKGGLLRSAHDLSAGGLALALTESCVSRKKPIGVTLEIENTISKEEFRPDALLFGESSARFLISFKPDHEQAVRALCAQHTIPITGSGEVGGKFITVAGAAQCSIPVSTAALIWSAGLDHLFGIKRQLDQ